MAGTGTTTRTYCIPACNTGSDNRSRVRTRLTLNGADPRIPLHPSEPLAGAKVAVDESLNESSARLCSAVPEGREVFQPVSKLRFLSFRAVRLLQFGLTRKSE